MPGKEISALIYGDSIMRGTVMDEGGRFHATMPGLLQKLQELLGVRAANRSRFGITITKGRDIVARDLQRGTTGEFALVEFGGNDCSFRWDEVSKDPLADHRPATELDVFCDSYHAIIKDLRGAGVTPVLMTLPPLDAQRHLSYLGSIGNNEANILKWLGDAHMIYRFHEKYSNAIAKIAIETGSMLVDVRGRFLDKHNLQELIGQDGVHPSPTGYNLILDMFMDFIAQHRAEGHKAIFA